jgi:UDP-N-acetylmuramoylalanine--D-glutamate ligase
MTLHEHQRHAVVGYGVEGKSTAQYLLQHGIKPVILDRKSVNNRELDSHIGDDWLEEIDSFDLAWRSPSVDPNLLPADRTTSQTQFFLEECKVPIIGVTATKGKGTICSLITAILRADGYQVWLVGNIGQPALNVLDEINSSDANKKIVVYEMSSFQLWDVTMSPQTAVIGMISQDHLDIHHSLEDYHQAKARVTKFQTLDDRLVFNAQSEVSKQLTIDSNAGCVESYNQPKTSHYNTTAIYYRQKKIIERNKVQLLGDHNAENICAALSVVWPIIQDKSIIETTLEHFSPLEHRMELLPNKNGISYVNDSYSSNPSATIAAVSSLKSPVVLLLGGAERSQDYKEVSAQLSAMTQLKTVITYGANAKKWGSSLNRLNVEAYIAKTDSFNDIFKLAKELAEAGDVVLFSPGSPSTDMFSDFTDRGNEFKRLVAEL